MAGVDYEVEYNNRARVPENPALMAGWARDAAAYREQHASRTIAYASGDRNTIDVFPGDNQGPIVVFIHGGYWQMTHQTKDMYSALAEGAVSHGLNVAIVEYTLAPEARMDWIVGEVRQAINWLHEHLGDYVPIRGASTSPATPPAARRPIWTGRPWPKPIRPWWSTWASPTPRPSPPA